MDYRQYHLYMSERNIRRRWNMNRKELNDYCVSKRGEDFFKWVLTRHFIEELFVYELPVGVTRVDFAYLGKDNLTYAFEIKSKHDSYKRLANQLSSYSLVFDFVSVVLDHKGKNTVKKFIEEVQELHFEYSFYDMMTEKEESFKITIDPENIGIYTIDSHDNLMCVREPTRTPLHFHYIYINMYIWELRLLDKKIRSHNFYKFKDELFSDESELFEHFKKCRFEKYKDKADFIRKNFNFFLPIDLKKIKYKLSDVEMEMLKEERKKEKSKSLQ